MYVDWAWAIAQTNQRSQTEIFAPKRSTVRVGPDGAEEPPGYAGSGHGRAPRPQVHLSDVLWGAAGI